MKFPTRDALHEARIKGPLTWDRYVKILHFYKRRGR